MRVILRELVRRPGRFLPVGGAMTTLVVLLVVLGGFLDGLELDQTGAFRSQDDRLWVVSASSELQLSRSRVEPGTAETIAEVDGVASVAGLSSFDTTASPSAGGELLDVVVFGYEEASSVLPDPPAAGAVVADSRVRDLVGAGVGDVLNVGPTREALEVVAIVDDVTQGGATLWVDLDAWRDLASQAAPARALPGDVVQALVVTAADSADPVDLGRRIDEATGGTETVDLDTLLAGQPVVAQQSATFQGIIGTTFVVVLLVVALFFALVILERVRLYAVLKAIGARSGDLARGVIAQAVIVSLGAFVLGTALSLGLVGLLPADLPVRVIPGRLAWILVGIVATSVLGVLLVLRRILRIEPARSIG